MTIDFPIELTTGEYGGFNIKTKRAYAGSGSSEGGGLMLDSYQSACVCFIWCCESSDTWLVIPKGGDIPVFTSSGIDQGAHDNSFKAYVNNSGSTLKTDVTKKLEDVSGETARKLSETAGITLWSLIWVSLCVERNSIAVKDQPYKSIVIVIVRYKL